jgi:hypothetical protein
MSPSVARVLTRRLAGLLAVAAAAAAMTVLSAPTAALAEISNPDVQPCDPEPGFPGICRDENWPSPRQYQAIGRDRDEDDAYDEAVDLARDHCPGYDTVRIRPSRDGNIYVLTLTYTCE